MPTQKYGICQNLEDFGGDFSEDFVGDFNRDLEVWLQCGGDFVEGGILVLVEILVGFFKVEILVENVMLIWL